MSSLNNQLTNMRTKEGDTVVCGSGLAKVIMNEFGLGLNMISSNQSRATCDGVFPEIPGLKIWNQDHIKAKKIAAKAALQNEVIGPIASPVDVYRIKCALKKLDYEVDFNHRDFSSWFSYTYRDGAWRHSHHNPTISVDAFLIIAALLS